MLAEPSRCGGFRDRKLAEIGIEMAAPHEGKAFGLQRALISGERRSATVTLSLLATTISNGVGETRETQAPGSYVRAARVERRVTSFFQRPSGMG
jgi:hypothetical protein